MQEVKNNAKENVIVFLIGNKTDIEDREVSFEQAVEFCQNNDIKKYFETSALKGLNVEEVFSLAAKELYAKELAKKGNKDEEEDTDDDNK